jgi:antitoxin MazE
MKTTVRKWGNSLALRVPRSLAVEANVREGAQVELRVRQGRLIVAPLRQRSLEALVAGVRPENIHGETDTGGPAGGEVW